MKKDCYFCIIIQTKNATAMAKNNQATGLTHNSLEIETVIVGNITAPKDLRIDGTVQGDVACAGKVVLGKTGSIVGNIQCTTAEIAGKVTGNISVQQSLTLKSSSIFEGDIQTASLIIEPGASLNGQCKMSRENA